MCFSLSFSRLCQNILSRPSPKNAEGMTLISIQIQFQAWFQVKSFQLHVSKLQFIQPHEFVSDAIEGEMECL